MTAQAAGESANDPRLVSRRWLLFKASIALNGVVGAVLAVPVLRYFFAPWRKDASYNSWVSLGSAMSFLQDKRASPSTKTPPRFLGWTTDNVACYVRVKAPASSTSSLSIARTWAAPCAGFRSRSCSCAHATAASITRTARAPPALLSAASLRTTGRSLRRIAYRCRADAHALEHGEACENFNRHREIRHAAAEANRKPRLQLA